LQINFIKHSLVRKTGCLHHADRSSTMSQL